MNGIEVDAGKDEYVFEDKIPQEIFEGTFERHSSPFFTKILEKADFSGDLDLFQSLLNQIEVFFCINKLIN